MPKKHREMGADGSFSSCVKTNISFFYYLDQPRVVFAQRYHISRAGCALTDKDEGQDSFGFAGGCSLDLALYLTDKLELGGSSHFWINNLRHSLTKSLLKGLEGFWSKQKNVSIRINIHANLC